MELEQALENIKTLRPRVAEQEIYCIRENRDTAIPILLEYVGKVVEMGHDLPEDYEAHDYAMFLLAEFRVKEAFPVFLEYLKFENDFLYDLISDTLTEDYGPLLASVATFGDIPEIKKIIENTELAAMNRLAAASALQVLYVEGVYAQSDYFDYLKYLLENFVNPSEPEFISFLAYDCIEVGATELFPMVEELFKEDPFAELFFLEGDIQECFQNADADSALQKLKNDRLHTYVTDTIESVGWWACFNEKPDYGRKVGRNEPCPCGSGKKYKKCCGYGN